MGRLSLQLHRGDIWWAKVPTDKRRPVLVLTREPFISRLGAVIVAPLTTTFRSIPTEVALGGQHGLPKSCAANFDNVFTLGRPNFDEFITRLDPPTMIEICRAYRFATGC